jgi:hypothetical protein
MSTISASAPISRSPWHLWVVAILTLVWNGGGAYTIMMAQAGRLTDVDANEAAYYAAQPLWFVIATGIALLLPLAAAVALLLRRRVATWLFALALIVLVVNNAYDIAAGTSLMLIDRGWRITTAIVVIIAVLQVWYAQATTTRLARLSALDPPR